MWRSSISNPSFFVRQHDKHQSIYLKVWTSPLYVTFLVCLMVLLSKKTPEKHKNLMKQSWQDFHWSVCLAICLSSKDWPIRSFCIKLLKSKKFLMCNVGRELSPLIFSVKLLCDWLCWTLFNETWTKVLCRFKSCSGCQKLVMVRISESGPGWK